VLEDIVVDTNVLMHADNPNEVRQADATDFLTRLLDAETRLSVDKGFELDESRNRSLIGSEYLTHLTPLSLGYRVLVQLAGTGRIRFVDRSLDQRTRSRINQLVPNKRDRTFVAVAYESDDQTLCSHDYQDFSTRVRRELATRLDVTVCNAGDACLMI
jgi:hypothetical protein